MKKIVITAILMGMTFFVLPGEGNSELSAQRQERGRREVTRDRDYTGARRTGKWGKKRTYGYRNYGQYRRTQVGNRRYRTVSRPYWRNGVRRTRIVRNYY